MLDMTAHSLSIGFHKNGCVQTGFALRRSRDAPGELNLPIWYVGRIIARRASFVKGADGERDTKKRSPGRAEL